MDLDAIVRAKRQFAIFWLTTKLANDLDALSGRYVVFGRQWF